MAKRPPERSKIERPAIRAYAKRHKTNGDEVGDDEAKPGDAGASGAMPAAGDKADAPHRSDPSAGETQKMSPNDLPNGGPPTAPHPVVTAADAGRAKSSTIAMPPEAKLGAPPHMPEVLGAQDIEDPAHLPHPRDIPPGEPTDPAPAPGRVPRGDSRSLRRAHEFALIYRMGTFVISRFGQIGTRGQWRVVEYPTGSSAANYYAKEASRFVTDGFTDYRE
jgi:hypothetical protein